MRFSVVVMLFGVVARAQSPAPKPTNYSGCSREDIRPGFALSANADSSVTAKGNVGVTWDCVAPNAAKGTPVHSITLGPTASLTEKSKAAVFSIGPGDKNSPDFGGTSFALGLLLGYSRLTVITEEELQDPAREAKKQAFNICQPLCAGTPLFKNADFCNLYKAPSPGNDPLKYDPSEFCPDGLDKFNSLMKDSEKKISKLRLQRYRFPEVDVSLWGGGGASRFDYYQQQSPAMGMVPATYASANAWQPNGGVAAQLNSVPPLKDGSSIGLTVQVPIFSKYAYQASKAMGTACKPNGTLATDGSTLSACSAAQPIGAPSSGETLTVEAYVRIVDRDNAYWRVALGGSYSRNFLNGGDTWAIKAPFYINATALGGGSKGGATDQPAKTPVIVDYAGIVRLTPALQFSSAPNQPTEWLLLLNLELLGQRNLFTRADNLVK